MRNILVISVGKTPQVVTETLYALAVGREADRFVPNEMYLLTTSEAEDELAKALCGERGKLSEFAQEFGLPAIAPTIIPARSAGGGVLADTRKADDGVAFANEAIRLIRDITQRESTQLHVSLAGGRKTMSFFMGYALSLFGRPADRLSHVLVTPAFEGCPDFWWIPRIHRDMPHRYERNPDGTPKLYNTAFARIDLAEIPIIKLHHVVPSDLFGRKRIDYANAVQQMQAAVDASRIELSDDACKVTISDVSFELRSQDYAMYRTFADAILEAWPGAGPDGVGSDHAGWLSIDDFVSADGRGARRFLDHWHAVDPFSAREETFRQFVADMHGWMLSRDRKKAMEARDELKKKFAPIVSRLRNTINSKLVNPIARARFGLSHKRHRVEDSSVSCSGLRVAPAEIVVRRRKMAPRNVRTMPDST